MAMPSYTITIELAKHQRNCRLILRIDSVNYPLSYDDTIEFKIEISKARDGGSANEIEGTLDRWRATLLPKKGGLLIEFQHPAHAIASLALNARQTTRFSEELQTFIDDVGGLS